MPIIVTLLNPIAFWRNYRRCAVGLNAINQVIGIVALIGQYRVRLHAIKQRVGLGNVGHLATGKQPAHRIAQRINDRMYLCRQSAARTAYRLITCFFWAPAACWCARTTVLSSISTSISRSPLTAATIRCHTPDLPHRLNLMYVVCQLPSSAGKSRHGEPVRTIHSTASKNSRLSRAVAPRSPTLPGNSGSSFFHWSSRSSFLTSCIFGIRLLKYRM